ncbi:hypothetical protein E2542_SST11999 [Spatholobus suberectus]|nr:hypothetical protein E2542_SST11999 [Spatholobus suberectus]
MGLQLLRPIEDISPRRSQEQTGHRAEADDERQQKNLSGDEALENRSSRSRERNKYKKATKIGRNPTKATQRHSRQRIKKQNTINPPQKHNKLEDLDNSQLQPCAAVQFAREPRDFLIITTEALMICFMDKSTAKNKELEEHGGIDMFVFDPGGVKAILSCKPKF